MSTFGDIPRLQPRKTRRHSLLVFVSVLATIVIFVGVTYNLYQADTKDSQIRHTLLCTDLSKLSREGNQVAQVEMVNKGCK